MKITILTTFPNMFDSFLNYSIIARAIANNHLTVKIVNFRDYTKDKNHRTDSRPIGGGAGLILKCQPIYDALKANSNEKTLKIILTPRGKTFNQKMAKEMAANYDDILIMCGHYEGIDERIYKYFDLELSIGDYILTGGETACFVLIDALSRLKKGVINEESLENETFNNNLIEYPQYTDPYSFNGYEVPKILYCGDHNIIKKYNLKKSLEYTKKYRPDLLKNYNLSKEETILLKELDDNITPKWELDAIEKAKKFTNKD